MQCKCGSEMKYGVHTVSTTNGKEKWVDEVPIHNLEIQQWDCPVCQRHKHKVLSNDIVIKGFG